MYKQFLGSRKVKNEQLPLCLFRQLWAYLRELLLFARARHRPKGKHFAFQRAWVTQRSDTFLSKEIRNITKVEYANLKTKAPSCTLNVIFNLFKFIFKNEIMMGLVIHLCCNSCCVSPMSYILHCVPCVPGIVFICYTEMLCKRKILSSIQEG